jgi:hypothetical protein
METNKLVILSFIGIVSMKNIKIIVNDFILLFIFSIFLTALLTVLFKNTIIIICLVPPR